MASSKQVLLLAVVAALASLASATVYMVGDELGWSAAFNHTGWADGKTFVVGDRLIFMYNKGNHTLAQVSKEDFAACNLQGKFLGGPWATGNDEIALDLPGKLWFICTVPGHCDGGMKLAVDVVVAATSPSAPAPFPWPFPFPFPAVPAPAPSSGFSWWGVPAAAPAPAPWFRRPFWPLPGVSAAAPSPWWGGSAAAPGSMAAPPSAAVRNPLGGAVAAAAAVVVAGVLAL